MNLRAFTGVEALIYQVDLYDGILEPEYQAVNFFYGIHGNPWESMKGLRLSI